MIHAMAGPPRVLVVDGEPTLLRLLDAILTGLGHATTLCGSPSDALIRLRHVAPFDLAVIDLSLAGEDGATLILSILAKAPRTRMIVSKGHQALPPWLEPFERDGRLVVLARPYSLADLDAAAQRLLGAARGPSANPDQAESAERVRRLH